MEVLGAVSGSIQLLDAAINLSRRTYNLFRALKHAGEDVSLLRTGKPFMSYSWRKCTVV
jgi:hypothetical protein